MAESLQRDMTITKIVDEISRMSDEITKMIESLST
jgi:hypothetical protein